MSKHGMHVTVEVDAATIKSLGRASTSLVELAGAYSMATNEPGIDTRRISSL